MAVLFIPMEVTRSMSQARRGMPFLRRPKLPTQWRPVDIVALVLALGLTLSIVMILLVTGLQVALGGSFPQVKLSENSTQILIAGIGGFTGLLGAYIGLNRGSKKSKPPEE
jgi:hypothetical protein